MTTSDYLLIFGTIFLWFFLPGVLLWLTFRDRCSKSIASGAAWAIVIGRRAITGKWGVSFGDYPIEVSWYVELMSAVVSWAIASIFVWLSYQLVLRVSHLFRRNPEDRGTTQLNDLTNKSSRSTTDRA